MRRVALATAALTIGCASTKPTEARREVGDTVRDRAGVSDVVDEDPNDDSRQRVRDRVAQLVSKPLTPDSAVRIALLNNRQFQEVLEELGIAQAQLVQAGLLENPVISGDVIISSQGHGLGGGLSLSQSLLSVFLIPAKKRLAAAHLRFAVMTVGQETLGLIRDVKVAVATAQAAEASLRLHRTLAQAAEVADELAAKQIEAGNITELDRELFAASLDEARIRLADSELEVTHTREALNQLLGLWGSDVSWTFAASLPAMPDKASNLSGLEARGVEQRLDISGARAQVDAMQYAIELRRRGVIPQIDAGVEAGNEVGDDIGHEWVIGPTLALEIPIFDTGRADFARLRAMLRQAQHQLQHAAIVARSEIRLHRQQLVTARRKATYYRDVVLPRRRTIGARTVEQYNAMLMGTYRLLETRVDQIQAQNDFVEALRDYWVARAHLELAVGGRI